MKTLQNLMQEIIEITTEIETKYPELYAHLDETPFHLGESKSKTIDKEDLTDYLKTLRSQLQHHVETHVKNRK
jgi:hypothetical protein